MREVPLSSFTLCVCERVSSVERAADLFVYARRKQEKEKERGKAAIAALVPLFFVSVSLLEKTSYQFAV